MRNKQKQKQNIVEQQLIEFEQPFGNQLMRERLEKLGNAFETGAMPRSMWPPGHYQRSLCRPPA